MQLQATQHAILRQHRQRCPVQRNGRLQLCPTTPSLGLQASRCCSSARPASLQIAPHATLRTLRAGWPQQAGVQQPSRQQVVAQAFRGTGDDWGSGGSSSSSGGGGGPLPDINPVGALKRELGMQSNKLDPNVKERVEAAIARLGYRVTVGQVAASAGVKLSEADAALKALAYDSLGNLEVSDQGEVVYAFDRDFVGAIRRRSWVQRLRPLWKKAVSGINYLTRVAFGTALIVSALVVWLSVIALMSSGRDDNRRGGGYYGGPRGYVFIDPTDFFLIWDPYYGRHTRRRVDSGEGMTFVEAVFSFVFGDGNPNESYEERRWRALGAHIQRLGGVLSAEEMAPFLDPPPLRRGSRGGFPSGAEKYEDESFVLPALIRFNGEPFVDDDGRLLYKFPDLQVVAGSAPQLRLTAQEAKVPLERIWEFSAASPGQQAGALLLGLVNVVGVITLSSLLLDPVAKLALYRQGLGFILGLLPYLQTYAAAFFALPVLRRFVDGRRNTAIEERNDNRLEAVSLLQSGDPDLAAKSASARKLGNTRVIGRQDIVYTTEQDTDAQMNVQEEDEFDRRLGRDGWGSSSSRQQQQQLPQGRANRIDDVFGRREQRQRGRGRDAQEIEVDWDGGSSSRRGESSRRQRQQQRRDDDWDRLDRW